MMINVWMRRVFVLLSLLMLFVSVFLLWFMGAAHPTGQRFSSQIVDTTASAAVIGQSGEQVLSAELGLPINPLNGGQCVCAEGNSVPNQCGVCFVRSPEINNFRVPDFVGQGFIADSKNVRRYPPTYERDFAQLRDFVSAARVLGVPLWIYVRVDTLVDPQMHALVAQTGGAIVPYFRTSAAYVDVFDWAGHVLAPLMLPASLLILLGVFIVQWRGRDRLKPVVPVNVPSHPAEEATRRAEDTLQQVKTRVRKVLDTDDL